MAAGGEGDGFKETQGENQRDQPGTDGKKAHETERIRGFRENPHRRGEAEQEQPRQRERPGKTGRQLLAELDATRTIVERARADEVSIEARQLAALANARRHALTEAADHDG